MLLVLVCHDVQNGISYDFGFERWPLHFVFPSYTSVYNSPNADQRRSTHRVQQLPLLCSHFFNMKYSISLSALVGPN